MRKKTAKAQSLESQYRERFARAEYSLRQAEQTGGNSYYQNCVAIVRGIAAEAKAHGIILISNYC